jgi:hypothetical protein
MKNKKYLMVDRYKGTVVNFDVQSVLDDGLTAEEFFGYYKKNTEGDYVSYNGEEEIIIELPA